MIRTKADLKGKKILVMGLGLNGGALACTRFLYNCGAQLTVTDLHGSLHLASSLQQLQGLEIYYVLGEHRLSDFEAADIVIKNPGVPSSSPYLKVAKSIETDLSIFLQIYKTNPILAVTGTKGKSSVVSSLEHIMRVEYPDTKLAGNIGQSPLSFTDELQPSSIIILELSSWQLADLRNRGLLHPHIAAITNLKLDHQNTYAKLEDYANDKKLIYELMGAEDFVLLPRSKWGSFFKRDCRAQILEFNELGSSNTDSFSRGLLLEDDCVFAILDNKKTELFSKRDLLLVGTAYFHNIAIAALMAFLYGLKPSSIKKAIRSYRGLAHRLEFIRSFAGVAYYNDSAASIPDATIESIRSFSQNLHLISGGTNKDLEFTDLAKELAAQKNIVGLYLLEGSATKKLIELLEQEGLPYFGPFPQLKAVFEVLIPRLSKGSVVLLSPASSSFEMFANEFERGQQFTEIVQKLT